MQNSSFQNQYTSVICWKCNAYNNFAQSNTCRQCGCYLRPHSNQRTPSTSQKTSSIIGTVVKFFLTIAVLSILSVAGYIFYTSNFETAKSQSTQANTAELPSNSWYQPSIWNFYRDRPTALEIVQKSNEATSKTFKPSDIRTISLNGTISFAFEKCLTEGCKTNEFLIPRKFTELNFKIKPPTAPLTNFEEVDDISRLYFVKLGRVEVYQKDANKVLRKISIRPLSTEPRKDISEGFDGVNGWKEEIVYNWDNTPKSSVMKLEGKDLEVLKKSSNTFPNKYSDQNLSFSHIGKVNGKAHFILKTGDPIKPESLYFDAVTGLLTKVEAAEMTCILFPYADYNGINFPSTLYFRSFNNEGKTMWMKIEEIEWKFNQPIDDSIFSKKVEN